MAAKLLYLFSLLVVSYSYQLTPFIAWSNSGIAQDIPISDDINFIISSLATEINTIDKVVIFTSNELSFDAFNKYVGVYGEEGQSQLRTAIESAKSHYWTGTQFVLNDDWISTLANNKEIKYMSGDKVHISQSGSKFVVIRLDDLSTQDNVIGSVMKETHGLSFLAIYTHSSQIQHRTRREVEDEYPNIYERAASPKATADNNNNENTKCRMGGQFLDAAVNSTASCLLFCLQNMTYNFTLPDEPEVTCILDTPYNIQACCSDQNYTMGDRCYGEPAPYVQFNFKVGTSNTSENMCSNTSFNFESANITVKFVFPYTGGVNKTSKWTIMLESDLSIVNELGLPIQENFDNITRVNPSKNLYQPFEINVGLSYACSAKPYNRYVQSFNQTTTNKNVSVALQSFQVQPYSVNTNTFASAYNCEGYFTSTTWMGIVTVVILLLILYLSLLCVFSLHTIDKFEDPRGQSISVEKLH